MNDKIEKQKALAYAPKPVESWFFERGDGFIFACNEAEAWDLLNNQSNWARKDFKLIGTSDGQTYFDHIKKSQSRIRELNQEVTRLQVEVQRYLAAEDRFKFELLLDENDDRVKRAIKLRSEAQEKLTVKEKELANIGHSVNQEAFDLELAKARGNVKAPRNQDVFTPEGRDRDKILRAMGK